MSISFGKKTIIPPNYLDTQNIQRIPIGQQFTATSNQTVFNLSNEYEIGKKQVFVEVDGVPQEVGVGFTESSTTSITLTEGVPAGSIITVNLFQTPAGVNKKLVELDQLSQSNTTQLAEKVSIDPSHYYVGKSQKYKTITAAYNQWVTDGKLTGVIHIFAGVYNEDINAGSNVNLTFIGEDKNTTIWKCTKGLYVNAPFTGSGGSAGLHFRNLTIEANHEDIPDYVYKASTGGGAYAIHCDDATSQGKTTIENCILISYQNSALGSGTRLNQEIVLKNVQLYHYAEQYSPVGGENTGANNGALLYHTSATEGHTGQKLKLHNVYAYSLKGPGIQLLSSSGGTVPVEVECINVTSRSTNYETFAVGSVTYENRTVFSNTNGLMVLTEDSKNNNSTKLNYGTAVVTAKLTQDNGLAVLVTDFNNALYGFFMGSGANGVLNTPTDEWYVGYAVSNSLTSLTVQYAWRILSSTEQYKRRRISNGTWTDWVRSEYISTTTSARETEVNIGVPAYDSTLNKPIWCKTLGNKEVDTLTITAGATTSGNITITLNGVAKTVAVVAGDSASTVGDKIRATIFTNWTAGGTGTSVTFSKKTRGTNTTSTFADTGTTGVTATFAVTTAGTNNVWVDATGATV